MNFSSVLSAKEKGGKREEWKREGRLGREKKKGRKMRKGEEKMRIRKREGG